MELLRVHPRSLMRNTACLAVSLLLLAGCASEQARHEYEDAASLPPLQVPTDLSAPVEAGAMTIPTFSDAPLPFPQPTPPDLLVAEAAGEAADEPVPAGRTGTGQGVLEGDELVVNDSFPRAWRRLGIALDRIGLVVEDRDRSQGIYYVRPVDLRSENDSEKGWFAGMFSQRESVSDEQIYSIVVRESGAVTRVGVRDESGRATSTAAARALLQSLHEQLR